MEILGVRPIDVRAFWNTCEPVEDYFPNLTEEQKIFIECSATKEELDAFRASDITKYVEMTGKTEKNYLEEWNSVENHVDLKCVATDGNLVLMSELEEYERALPCYQKPNHVPLFDYELTEAEIDQLMADADEGDLFERGQISMPFYKN